MQFEDMINKLINADCYEFIKEIPDNSIDLIITDPPYEYTTGGCGKNQTGKYKELFDRKNKNRDDLEKLTVNSKMSDEDYELELKKGLEKGLTAEQARTWADKVKNRIEIKSISSGFDFSLLDELDRVMKKINIYIWCSKHQVQPLLKHYIDKDCNIEILTWHKSNPLPTMNNTYANDTEYCIFAREKGVNLYGNYETKKKYYITPINLNDKDKFIHPTIKPVQIIENLVINSSKEDDIVLDCFCGSGTTCVACKNTNRKYIGIEINEEYYKIATKRLNNEDANGQMSLFTN